MRLKLVIYVCLMLPVCALNAQTDSSIASIQQISTKYLESTGKKIDKYQSRISNKTEKTLQRLTRWESKIQRTLQKVDPATAQKLFAPGQPSFKQMLDSYKSGESAFNSYANRYDQYNDQLSTQFKFLDSNKSLLTSAQQKLVNKNNSSMQELLKEEKRIDVLQKMIKERKKQLVDAAVKQLGKNKHLQKLNKETYYYAETIRNYKQLYKNKEKREETAKKLLQQIPGFNDFVRRNSMLASLFKMQGNPGDAQALSGLQTRASVNSIIQDRIAAGGPNARAQIQQNIQQGQAELSKLKDKILKAGGGNSHADMPDFKPNQQRSKTFGQRMEYGFNFQFGKRNNFVPGGADIGLTAGYKLNDKSTIGVGLAYKLGIGNVQKIKFSHEGIGLRSYLDWKLKKQFFISGGFEMNHNSSFRNFGVLGDADVWQQSGLLGISKKIPMKTKLSKGTKLQLLYDFLHRQHLPVSQPIIFRVGYDLK